MKDIQEFLKNFTDEDIGPIELKKNTYYFKSQNKIEQATSQGLPLGTTGKYFKPSLYLLEILSKKTTNKIFINDKAEWLFLCGRDVFEESITQDNSKTDVVLVQNQKNENIGLGKKTWKGKKMIIKNLIDRGDYLRRER